MARIFICHAFEDFHLATQLKLNFKPHEISEILQTDYERLDDVDQHEKIIQKIQGCDQFILVWTQNAELSPEVMFEWTNALNLHVDFLVCQFDDTQLPAILRESKRVTFDSFKQGMALLKKYIIAPGSTVPGTTPAATIPVKNKREPKVPMQKLDADATEVIEGPIFVGTASTQKIDSEKPGITSTSDLAFEPEPVPDQAEYSAPDQTSWENSYQQSPPGVSKAKSGYRLEIIIPAIIMAVLLLLVTLILMKKGKSDKMFRATATAISEQGVRQMLKTLGFFAVDWNEKSTGYLNEYIIEEINGNKIIRDENSGLVWQQGGSEQPVESYKAEVYIAKLNQINFGGYSDWRLPTLEEAMTLMEPYLNPQELHIDPIFKGIWCIWTADSDEFGQRWAINFYNRPRTDFTDDVYVRACR